MASKASILIVARNAGRTIYRAVRSAVEQGAYPIILIDDCSVDDTVVQACSAADTRLTIMQLSQHESLGAARHAGLMAIKTPYGMWLDADDELLPGRMDRFVRELETERADIIADAAVLYDGPGGVFLKNLPIPAFLFGHHPVARLFERNYLPGPGVIGFRTQFAQMMGYDSSLHGSEDMDFLLRSIRADARIHLSPVPGYRMYAYPESLSRDLDNQRRQYRHVLLKHPYKEVFQLYIRAGYSERIAVWGLISMAFFREEYSRALEFIDQAAPLVNDPDEILEANGACNAPEGWRLCFFKGTAMLYMGRAMEAVEFLKVAEAIAPTPEAANNLGVAYRKLNKGMEAKGQFELSLARFPEFQDAGTNLLKESSLRITSHPLRFWAFRNRYPDIKTEA